MFIELMMQRPCKIADFAIKLVYKCEVSQTNLERQNGKANG